MAVDYYPIKCVSGASWVKVCDSRCLGVIGSIGCGAYISNGAGRTTSSGRDSRA